MSAPSLSLWILKLHFWSTEYHCGIVYAEYGSRETKTIENLIFELFAKVEFCLRKTLYIFAFLKEEKMQDSKVLMY